MRILILEDDQRRIDAFNEKIGERCIVEIVKTARLAIQCLTMQKYDVVFLDHDLGGETYVDPSNENTGSGVVRWMLKNVGFVEDPDIVIHSMNTPAAEAMERDLKTAYGFVYRVPFPALIKTLPESLNQVF